jgi:aryl-alcohol dehydrogenase-like predicted oxidoreductase
LTLTELALAFIEQQPFNEYDYWSNNIRAVKENIDTINVTLSENVLKAINEVQAMIPDPAP